MITIKKETFKKLYDIACKDWKAKFKEMFAEDLFSDSLSFKDDFIKVMQKACTKEQLPVFTEIFQEYLPKQAKLDTLEDIYATLNVKERDFIPYSRPITKEEKSLNAQAILFKVFEAYNLNEEKCDWKKSSQYKYFMYKYWTGSAWGVGVNVYCDVLICPAGLHSVNSAKVQEIYDKFTYLFEDMWMV